MFTPQLLDIDSVAPKLIGIGLLDHDTPHLGVRNVAEHRDGHAAFMLGNTCPADRVVTYFEDGRTPPSGTTCPGELAERIPDHP